MHRTRTVALALGLALIASPLLGGVTQAPSDADHIIFLLRHAEKAQAPPGDPPLTEDGQQRAVALADLLRDAGITGIWSTDFARTRDTAAPLAADLGLTVQLYDASDLGIAAGILRGGMGRVLVVGHSNTTPELVGLLGGNPGPSMADWEYNRLYMLEIHPDGTVTTLVLRYGERSRPPGVTAARPAGTGWPR